jgi:4a-hydroxytetrahydrobiopterin dehydratase
MDLTQKKCAPCEGGVPKLEPDQVTALLASVDGWAVTGERILKHYRFKDFKTAMKFVNAIADLAEEEGHHPDFTVREWNHVDVATWTHAIDGLSENDFILAAKIDRLHRQLAGR